MITAQGGITKWQRVRISSDGGMVAGKLVISKDASYPEKSSMDIAILLEKNDCVVHRVKLQSVSLIEFAQYQGSVLNNNSAVIGVMDKLHMVSSFNLSF